MAFSPLVRGTATALIALILPALLTAQVRVNIRVANDTGIVLPDSIGAHRIPVTAEHLRTAFKDVRTRTIFEGARKARLEQDAELRSYDATTYSRMSIGLSFRATGRERLALREETATHVRWQRENGVIVDVVGARATAPMVDGGNPGACGQRNRADACMGGGGSTFSPIPYFPGAETLWIGSGVAKAEVSEDEMVHPLAQGAEAYYKYEAGDSLKLILNGTRTITIIELKVLPRAPKSNVSVGSFWFDTDTYRLVRAVYRLAAPVDIWEAANDSGADVPGALTRAIVSPMRGTISAITIEFGLFEQRFWLPHLETIEGTAQVMIARIPFTMEQRFEYASVNQPFDMPAIPRPAQWYFTDSLRHLDSLARGGDTLARAQAKEMRDRFNRDRFRRSPFGDSLRHLDSLAQTGDSAARRTATAMRARDAERARVLRQQTLDTLRHLDSLAARGDTAARRRAAQIRPFRECDTATTTTRVNRRFGTLPVMTHVPCDANALIHSPALPADIFDPDEKLFGSGMRDQLLARLGLSLQGGFAPQLPTLRYGFGNGLMRYNRVEGLSPALGVDEQFGAGFTAHALVRLGTADKWLNGELHVARSDGTREISLGAYRRLAVANDWGTPLSFGSSFSALVFGRDEGFFYRAWGAELTASTARNPSLTVRLFAERQLNAPVETQFSFAHSLNHVNFIPNVMATEGSVSGASVRLVHSLGIDPRGLRLLTEVRAEEGFGDFLYGRALADVTISHSIGKHLAGALTASAGYASEHAPPQRQFFLGGSPTIRGQKAGTAVGPTYWFARAELGTGSPGVRRIIFADIGWAGDKHDWSHPGRPLSGVGVGTSFLDGLIRFDLSRGIYPRKSFTFDAYLEARF